MSDIAALEGRITAALDRIREGMARQQSLLISEEPSDAESLRAQLKEERIANAQLENRVSALKVRQDGTISDFEGRVASHATVLAAMEAEVHRLRVANAELLDVTAQLRVAAVDGITAPELLNRATLAEVEALQAQRASEATEMDAIISSLKPLIEEVYDAAD